MNGQVAREDNCLRLSVSNLSHDRLEANACFTAFHNQGKLYELYAREVTQSTMYAFVEIADIIFGEKSQLVVDPSEERLKQEFSSVKRTYIPLHAIVRIDEVDKEGVNKIIENGGSSEGGNVAPFPMPPIPRGS